MFDESELEKMREERMKEFKEKKERFVQNRESGYGRVEEIMDEKNFYNVGLSCERFLCHFYKENTFRCEIMDNHLKSLADRHLEIKICRVNVEKNLTLCEKLKVRVIPTLLYFYKGQLKNKMLGFDEFGGQDDFETKTMEQALLDMDILEEN